MQLASVAQNPVSSVHYANLNKNILEIIDKNAEGINSNQIWSKIVLKTGNKLPRALVLSRLETLASIGIIKYSNRAVGSGYIREYKTA